MKHIVLLHLLINEYLTTSNLSSCWGSTATPERSDEFHIIELFDYNIAYEIRLQTLESDILCPFHYFGVTDYVHRRY